MSTPPAAVWRRMLRAASECVQPRECRVVQGQVPDDLRGTLYRIGAGDAAPYEHWFDGDGWACAVAFRGPEAPPLFRARYVDTARRRAQAAWTGPAGQRAARGVWTQRGDGRVLQNSGRLPTNPSNTNLLLRDGRLLVLCEGGPPAVLDPGTLATLDPADACGVASFFGAHPRTDPATGTLVGCGLQLGAMSCDNLLPSFPPRLNFFEWKANEARPGRQRAHALPFFTFVHDLAITPTRALVLLPPYVIPDIPTYAAAVLGRRAVGMAFEWRPELGTRVMVIDRETLEVEGVARLPDPAPTAYHIINAWEDEGEAEGVAAVSEGGSSSSVSRLGSDSASVSLLICEQANGDRAELEAQYRDIQGAVFTPGLQCKAVEYRLQLPGRRGDGRQGRGVAACVARVEHAAAARPFELPEIHPAYVGRRARYAHTWCQSADAAPFADALQRVELRAGGAASPVVAFGPGRAAGAPLFVPRGRGETDGYLLTFVYDASREESDLVVLDAADLEGGPVCTVALGQHVPPLFHGIWSEEVHMDLE